MHYRLQVRVYIETTGQIDTKTADGHEYVNKKITRKRARASETERERERQRERAVGEKTKKKERTRERQRQTW